MSDRYNYLTVVLDDDIRYDDAEPLIKAIKQLRGVLSVKGNVSNSDDYAARERARIELLEKVYKVFKEKP